VVTVSRNGIVCRAYADCTKLLALGRAIDYDGASGPIDLTDDGNPTRADVDVFTFDDTGKDVTERQMLVTNRP